jgi:hypothetical protein
MRQLETAKRKGLTGRTVLAILWLGLCSVAAYYVMAWLFESGALRMGWLYSRLGIPLTVDPNIVRVILVFVLVMVMQFFVVVGYAWGSPLGRLRPANPSLRTTRPDLDDSMYYRH